MRVIAAVFFMSGSSAVVGHGSDAYLKGPLAGSSREKQPYK
jgi:hypothetical protein